MTLILSRQEKYSKQEEFQVSLQTLAAQYYLTDKCYLEPL